MHYHNMIFTIFINKLLQYFINLKIIFSNHPLVSSIIVFNSKVLIPSKNITVHTLAYTGIISY